MLVKYQKYKKIYDRIDYIFSINSYLNNLEGNSYF